MLLEQTAQDMPLACLIRWIDEHAVVDPRAALAAYAALCSRARKASEEDLRVLVGAEILRRRPPAWPSPTREASLYLVTLLSALPKRALRSDAVAQLAASADPVLLHALDTVARPAGT